MIKYLGWAAKTDLIFPIASVNLQYNYSISNVSKIAKNVSFL